MKLKIVLEPSEEGGYTVYAPSLPGCISEGETKEEAIKNIREAIELYLDPVDDEIIMKNGVEVEELTLSVRFPVYIIIRLSLKKWLDGVKTERQPYAEKIR